MQLAELINAHRQQLNNTDMGIWKYILQHRTAVRHSSIHELAKACHVSTTTIVRFAQKLGLDGFGEFKMLLKREEPEISCYDTMSWTNSSASMNRPWTSSAAVTSIAPVLSSMKPTGFLPMRRATSRITSSRS